MKTYSIIRMYEDYRRRTMKRGLTLSEAQEHCGRSDTQGVTRSGVRFFDGYEEEKR